MLFQRREQSYAFAFRQLEIRNMGFAQKSFVIGGRLSKCSASFASIALLWSAPGDIALQAINILLLRSQSRCLLTKGWCSRANQSEILICSFEEFREAVTLSYLERGAKRRGSLFSIARLKLTFADV